MFAYLLCFIISSALPLSNASSQWVTRHGDSLKFTNQAKEPACDLGIVHHDDRGGFFRFFEDPIVKKGFLGLVYYGHLHWAGFSRPIADIIGGDSGKIVDDAIQLLEENWQYLIVFGVIVLLCTVFLLVYPCVAVCFCGCRCRGRCGARRTHKSASAARFCLTSTVLLFSVLLLGLGAAFAFVSQSKAVEDIPDKLLDFGVNTLEKSPACAHNTIGAIFDTALGPVGDLTDILKDEISSAETRIVDSMLAVADSIDPGDIDNNVTEADRLATRVQELWDNTYYDATSTQGQNMYNISELIEQIVTKKDAICALNPICENSIDELAKHKINPSSIPTTSVIALNNNLASVSVTQEFNKIRNETKNEINDTIAGEVNDLTTTIGQGKDKLKDAVDGFKTTIQDEISSLEKSVIGDIVSTIDSVKGKSTHYKDKYSKFLWPVLVIPPAIVFAVAALGLVLGIVGYDSSAEPHERTELSNQGGHLACTSSVLAMALVWFFVLLFALPFLLLSPLQWTCKGLQDRHILHGIGEVTAPVASFLYGEEATDVFTEVIEVCETGGTLWRALRLGSSQNFNITEQIGQFLEPLLNTSGLIPAGATFNLGNFNLTFIQTLVDQMDTLANQTLQIRTSANLTIGAYSEQLKNNASTSFSCTAGCKPLLELIDGLLVYKNDDQDLMNLKKYSAQFIDEVADFYTTLDKLEDSLQATKLSLERFNASLADVSANLTADALDVVLYNAELLMIRLLKWLDEYIVFFIGELGTNIGKCGFIADMYSGAYTHLCEYTVLRLTELCVAVGIIAACLLSISVCGVRAAKHYRRMRFLDPRELGPPHGAPRGVHAHHKNNLFQFKHA